MSDSLFNAIIEGTVQGIDGNELMAIPVEPLRMNRRLAVQQGLFVAPLHLEFPLENNLFGSFSDTPPTARERRRRREVYAGTDLNFARNATIKFVLPPDVQEEALIDLRRMNISHASLFPDLEGFGRSMLTYFLPDWPSLASL